MAYLKPDRYFTRLSAIDIDNDLLRLGYRNVLLDVDNTLLRRDNHLIPRDIALWLSKARNAGIQFCLLSNNWHSEVYDLANRLNLPIVAKAIKPLPPAFLLAMGKLRATHKDCIVIGDQLVTDVVGAHTVGLPVYMLAPLVEQDLPHTLMFRHFERLVMGDTTPEEAPASIQALETSEEGHKVLEESL
ncbi:MAG: YqeG family HAD IIIA-type phosphatase [Eggerthellaceae bacterium]|jgi:HAD superfamily phosphatase (TIGR01668 family)